MRCELQTHPKIVRILSATKADKFRVIGGLHSVWSVFDAHSTDGVLFGYTPDTLDHVIGWDGFSKAMISVGWLIYDGAETLSLPEFDEHNGKSGKRRAEDQKRKRNGRKEDDSPKDVRNESGQNADKKRTREEKRREDKNNNAFALPDWVPDDAWNDFEQMRVKRKKPLTDRARTIAVSKLDALRSDGHDVRAVIEQTVLHSWDTFYELRAARMNGHSGNDIFG